jgi:hypothetical protein
VEHFDPSTLSHLPAIDEAMKNVLSGAENRIGVRGVDGVVRLLTFAYNRLRGRGISALLESRFERIEDTITALIDDLQVNGLNDALEGEVAEPSASSFAADAIEDAVASPSEAKRTLLGRMIARRMSSSTESLYELYLRDARRLVSGLNDNQLTLLATLLLVSFTPIPLAPFETDASVAEFFQCTYGTALEKLGRATWSRSDVEKLLADDAIAEVSGEDIGETRNYYPPRFTILETVTRTFNSRDNEWDHISSRVNELFLVSYERSEMPPHLKTPITDLWLRPAGAMVAALVLEPEIARRIRFTEWESLSVEELRASDLVAPFNSAELSRQAHQQHLIRRRALRETLEQDAPDIVGKRMADSMRRYPFST